MKNLIQSLIKAAKDCGYVQKLGKNPVGYSYATEASVVAHVRESLLENGLVLVPDLIQHTFDPALGLSEVFIKYTLFHESGEMLEFKMAGQGMDKNSKGIGDKAIYKAITGANKYALLKLFAIATGDDPENEKEDNRAKLETGATVLMENSAKLIIEFLSECKSVPELEKYWKDNLVALKQIQSYSSDLYTEILSAFGKTKKTLKGEV